MTPQDIKPIPTCLRLGCPCHEGGECESAKRLDTKEEQLARTIHEWYLESIKELHPESYNPNAQKSYDGLTEEQKSMDRYMARKISATILSAQKESRAQAKEEARKDIWQFLVAISKTGNHKDLFRATEILKNVYGISLTSSSEEE